MARKTLLPMANVFVGAMLGLVALHAVNLYVGKKAYGDVQFALAWMGILYLFADLSMDQAHVKRVSEGMDPGDCFVTYARFRIVAALGFLVVAALSVFVWTVVLHRAMDEVTLLALVFCAFYYVMKGAQSVAQSTFDARLETARSQVGSLIETVVRVGITLVAAVLFQATIPYVGRVPIDGALGAWVRSYPAAALAFAYFAGSAIAAIVMLVYLRRSVGRAGRFRWTILQSYFAFALPLFLPSMAGLIGLFIDRTMLSVFGSTGDTADFAGPRQIVGVLEGIAGGVSLLLFPTISAMVAADGRDDVAPLVDRSVRYLVIVTLPVIAFLAAFPLAVIRLGLSAEYEADTLVMSVLAIWAFFLVASRPHLNLILGHGHARIAARVGIVQSLLVIVLNLVLIPSDIKSLHLRLFGLKALGAAISTLASGIVGYAMLTYYAAKIEGYRQRVALWKHFAAALVMVAMLWPLSHWTPFAVGRAYAVVGIALVGMAIFLAALWLLRELTRADLAFARGTLDPREMVRYLRSELFHRKG